MAEEKRSFEAEVSKLLQIVANALYSEKEIFLRELISNASDACDRLRYAALTEPELADDDARFRITLALDRKGRTLSVADNGVGMNREELVTNLGTIARSGTTAFLEQLSDDAPKDLSLIGQFGVGFYSAFIVADEVVVTSRKASDPHAWSWRSDGAGEFTVADAERAERGTTVTLHLKKGEDEFLDPERLRTIVKTYSDHIALPIELATDGAEGPETLNTASALWTRPKKDITPEQYKEFYHHVGHAFDDPWLTVHARAEGRIEYAMLLFVPSARPFDLFDPARKPRVKLYVKRVFISDDSEDLVPPYLRFVRGIVDSEDLPLNISREMLQNNPVVRAMRKALTKRVLGELQKKADEAPEDYATFWNNFGAVLKEGIYEDAEHRDTFLKLARFHTTRSGDGLASLADYASRLREGQDAIYYITGNEIGPLRQSPQLEGFAAKEVEVLLLTDPVDEFWVGHVGEYEGKPFKSVTRGGADLGTIKAGEAAEPEAETAAPASELDTLIALLKLNLGEKVKDVRPSDRLTDSAVCLIADEGDLDMHLERLLKQHNQEIPTARRILEINPRHRLIRALAESAMKAGAADALADASELLLDQARIIEGEPLPDPGAFSRRLADVMTRGLAV